MYPRMQSPTPNGISTQGSQPHYDACLVNCFLHTTALICSGSSLIMTIFDTTGMRAILLYVIVKVSIGNSSNLVVQAISQISTRHMVSLFIEKHGLPSSLINNSVVILVLLIVPYSALLNAHCFFHCTHRTLCYGFSPNLEHIHLFLEPASFKALHVFMLVTLLVPICLYIHKTRCAHGLCKGTEDTVSRWQKGRNRGHTR